jgi:hypothetical protein
MSSISRTASVANSFDTKSQDSALLSGTLADLFTNNTNHRGRPTITPAQIGLVKKAIRSYFRSAPTDDYREIIDAEVRYGQYLDRPAIDSLTLNYHW